MAVELPVREIKGAGRPTYRTCGKSEGCHREEEKQTLHRRSGVTRKPPPWALSA